MLMIKYLMLREKLSDLIKREEGASAIEYTIIAALIAAVLVTAMGTLTDSLDGAFAYISGVLDDARAPE